MFISAKEKTNLEELKNRVYAKVKELHVQKYPYNDFLFQRYDEQGELI
jgi:GTP-binding protein HflX